MGNWRRVSVVGHCAPEELGALQKAIEVDENYENYHCFSKTDGLFGLGNWAETININSVGNLAERDYTVTDILETLTDIVKKVPSLQLVVHVGDDWESSNCIATVKVENGVVIKLPPSVPTIATLPQETVEDRLFKVMHRETKL